MIAVGNEEKKNKKKPDGFPLIKCSVVWCALFGHFVSNFNSFIVGQLSATSAMSVSVISVPELEYTLIYVLIIDTHITLALIRNSLSLSQCVLVASHVHGAIVCCLILF